MRCDNEIDLKINNMNMASFLSILIFKANQFN